MAWDGLGSVTWAHTLLGADVLPKRTRVAAVVAGGVNCASVHEGDGHADEAALANATSTHRFETCGE